MLTQQELLVSELMGIMLSIQNSKDDRPKKVGWLCLFLSVAVMECPYRSRSFGIHCLLRRTCCGFGDQSDCL